MIFVPTPYPDSPAFRALDMEGAAAVEVVCLRPRTYGELFAERWNHGKPFVIVEWDIVPHPGACSALLACPEPYCTHKYPLQQGHLVIGMGVGKYTPVGVAPREWRETSWQYLDGAVVPVLNERLGRPHVHEPAVAHARSEVPA